VRSRCNSDLSVGCCACRAAAWPRRSCSSTENCINWNLSSLFCVCLFCFRVVLHMLLFLFLISIPLCFYTLFLFLIFLAFDFFLLFGLFIFFLCAVPSVFISVHFLFYFRSAFIFSISFHPSIFLLLLLSLFSFIFVVAVFITPLVSWECLLLQLRASTIVNRFSWNSLLLKTFSSPHL